MFIKDLNLKPSLLKLSSVQLDNRTSKPEVVFASQRSFNIYNPSSKVSDSINNRENILKLDSLSNKNNNRSSHTHKISGLSIKPNELDLETASIGSVTEDLDPKDFKQVNSQRRSSVLRRWAQHTDIPYIIGAQISEENHGLCGRILLSLSWLLIVLLFPFSLLATIKVVQEYERAVIFRLGRLVKGGAKGPGLFIVLPCIESYTKVDMRTVSFDVPPQEVLTKDSVTVAVDAVVYYRVFNPVISIANVENSQESTRLLAQTSLRNVLGTNSLAEILSNREAVSSCMREILDDATDQWGIKVERVEIKDVRLPIQLQRAMAAEAEATREARAKVIAAEGEHKSSRALKEAADILSQSPSAIQLRYLQTLNNIAAEKNSTIVFPLPIEILSQFMKVTKPSIQKISQNTFKSLSTNENSYESDTSRVESNQFYGHKKQRAKQKDATEL
ncbi:unnamed protein product [Brachionus calyciflorus]|uniref:Band 7 domain-containing protein n=1 Tax=Brachionus calyciflorus TaxID=104777 RepID=A0A813LXW4_9BILA|nr:unnamed protein product [Brachionus calyciflorus]